jgi:hypothetical protein
VTRNLVPGESVYGEKRVSVEVSVDLDPLPVVVFPCFFCLVVFQPLIPQFIPCSLSERRGGRED